MNDHLIDEAATNQGPADSARLRAQVGKAGWKQLGIIIKMRCFKNIYSLDFVCIYFGEIAAMICP